jgi:hypothetical protein
LPQWSHIWWLQEGRAGFCRRPLALPELPTTGFH